MPKTSQVARQLSNLRGMGIWPNAGPFGTPVTPVLDASMVMLKQSVDGNAHTGASQIAAKRAVVLQRGFVSGCDSLKWLDTCIVTLRQSVSCIEACWSEWCRLNTSRCRISASPAGQCVRRTVP